MCKVLRLALLGVLLAVPLAADQPATSSPESCVLSLSPVATAESKIICPQQFPDCENCFPNYVCSRQYDSVTFVRQKPNLVCVYSCDYTDTCTDVSCGGGDLITSGTHRVRSEPNEYPLGGCPPADIDFCINMAVE